MLNVVFARIDDRLIHGQVMTAWLQFTRANRIVIVDDGVAKDKFIKSVLTMSIPPGIKLDICDVENGAKLLNGEPNGKDKIIVLAKHPNSIYGLLEKEVLLKTLNIGGMGANVGRKKLYKNISASPEELETYKKIMAKGIAVSIQIIPDDSETPLNKII